MGEKTRKSKDRPTTINFNEFDPNLFRENLRKLLADNRMSQSDLMVSTGFDKNTITNCCHCGEVGGTKEPSIKTICRLAQVFKISIDELLGRADPRHIDREKDDIIRKEIIDYFNSIIERRGGNPISEFIYNHNIVQGLRISYTVGNGDREGIYPRLETQIQHPIHSEDTYAIIGGNIYPCSYDGNPLLYSSSDIPVYDYLNGHGDIDGLIKAYNKNRHFLGVIGVLNANDFIWLCYRLGYLEKAAKMRD